MNSLLRQRNGASAAGTLLTMPTVAGKRNEITAIPLLLERLELTGALVTIDAICGQRGIAETIRGKGADYLLALKNNQPTLAEEVRLFFEREPESAFTIHQTTDGDQAASSCAAVSFPMTSLGLSTSRRFPGEPRFPALAMIAMVDAEVERGGETSIVRRYYLSSAPLTAAWIARAVRAYWGIENRLYWVMDVIFHDDLMRLRTDSGPANMAAIHHAALNLICQIPDKSSFKIRPETVCWNDNYLLNGITQHWQ